MTTTDTLLAPATQNTAAWATETVWWHLYPLGFCDAPIRPAESPLDTAPTPRLRRLINWLDYAVDLGIGGLLLGPIFTSRSHGYDTLDHFQIDPRLGSEQDFADLIAACKARGLRVVLDGVFSHVGDQHPWLLSDIARGPEAGDLFDIDWSAPGGPRPRVWEGHGNLARLNHGSDAAVNFVTGVMRFWLDKGVDGWRLDAAYSVPNSFWTQVISQIRQEFPAAWLLGEVIHGDYVGFVSGSGVNSVTQYELWKAVYSSLTDKNMWELDWTLSRHNDFLKAFVPQTFIGNHDVTRIATKVGDGNAVIAAAILFTVGGIPSIYAGDEQGLAGVKEERLGGDDAIRPAFPHTPDELADRENYFRNMYRELIALRRQYPWLAAATTATIHLENTRYTYRTTARDGGQWLETCIDLESGWVQISDSDRVIWAAG